MIPAHNHGRGHDGEENSGEENTGRNIHRNKPGNAA